MECKESDPNRFDNRGGKLLKEEKERKKISRELPRCEEAIVKEISTWENDTGRIFTVFGHKFSDYLNQQKEEVNLCFIIGDVHQFIGHCLTPTSLALWSL